VDHARAVVRFFGARPRVLALVGGIAAYSALSSFAYYFFQDLLAGSGLSRLATAGTYAFGTILAAGAAIASYRVERVLGRFSALLIAVVATAAAFAVLGSGAAVVLVVGFCVLAAADSAVESLGKAAVTDAGPADQRATTLSVLSLVSHILTLLVTPTVGFIAGATGLGGVLSIVGVATMAVTALCLKLYFSSEAARSPLALDRDD
jgi:hypothetical protein